MSLSDVINNTVKHFTRRVSGNSAPVAPAPLGYPRTVPSPIWKVWAIGSAAHAEISIEYLSKKWDTIQLETTLRPGQRPEYRYILGIDATGETRRLYAHEEVKVTLYVQPVYNA